MAAQIISSGNGIPLGLRSALKEGYNFCLQLRGDSLIGVETEDPVACGLGIGPVAVAALNVHLALENTSPKFLGSGHSVVSALVIDHQDLLGPTGRVDAFPDPGRLILGEYDH